MQNLRRDLQLMHELRQRHERKLSVRVQMLGQMPSRIFRKLRGQFNLHGGRRIKGSLHIPDY